MSVLGVVLILVGLVALVVKGIEYTTHETVVDAGPLEIEAEHKKSIPLGPVVGGAALLAGVALVVVGRRS